MNWTVGATETSLSMGRHEKARKESLSSEREGTRLKVGYESRLQVTFRRVGSTANQQPPHKTREVGKLVFESAQRRTGLVYC